MANISSHGQAMVMASWSKLDYAKRLFLWLLCYSLLMVGCFVAFQYHREKQFKAEELNARLQIVNTNILNSLKSPASIDSVLILEPTNLQSLRVSVIDSTGRVLCDNSLDSLPEDFSHLQRSEIATAMLKGSGYTVRRHSQSTGQTYFYAATKGSNGIIVRTAVPYSVSLTSLLKADYGFLWFMALVTIVMCILGFYATHRLGQNIRRLSLFTEKAEKGERISDTQPFPNDELGTISGNIVRLYSQLQQAIADRDREHSRAMHQQLEKERIKKQLTNNINHELKTPVASIQICLETLLSHPNLATDKRNEFLTRSLTNAHRLNTLLADVALITRMDDGGTAIAKAPFDLSKIITEAIAEQQPAARTKGLEITSSLPQRIPINGNASLMLSAFHNLISNAIMYSGATNLDISAKIMETRVYITVADNGCGVSQEHLPHIFERFYRVDKGRSRAAGGTGLGLAIVKNAIIFHNGSITASTNSPSGLLHSIVLPVSDKTVD